MPQDDKKIAQKKLDELRKKKSTPEQDSAFKAARDRAGINIYSTVPAKTGPSLSGVSAAHMQNAQSDKQKVGRDKPLSATPEAQNRMLDLNENNK